MEFIEAVLLTVITASTPLRTLVDVMSALPVIVRWGIYRGVRDNRPINLTP